MRLDRPRWAGSPLAYRLGLTLGRQLVDGEIHKWYVFLAEQLRERGSDTLPWGDQAVFLERLLGLYQDSGKDLGLYTEDMLGAWFGVRRGRFTVPTAVEKVAFAAKERIVLHGYRRTATLLPFNRVCAVPEVRARPIVTIRPSADWLSEYDWDEAAAQALHDGPADVALLQVPMPDPRVPVGAVALGTDAGPAELTELTELAQDRPQLLLSARYLAPALADEHWRTEGRPLRALLARLVDVAEPVVVLDIELNILVAVWAATGQAMSVSWFSLGTGSGPSDRDLAVVVAAFADSDPLFLGVCRRNRAEEVVKALTGIRSLKFTRRPTEAFTDVARARAIAEHLVLTRSYVGTSPVEETPL
jgi:hypothetical protein